jgi:hydrogenase expression/formation protein HypD
MKFVDEYRDRDLMAALAARIRKISTREVVFMEVCGGHTMAIHRFGLHAMLPPTIRLLSGPGCPVCVSGMQFIDKAMVLAAIDGVIIATYGDLIRVPGSGSSLEKEKAKGRDIRIIYSVTEALQVARDNPSKKVVFPGIGFETTAPLTAAAILEAEKEGIRNFFVLSSHKVMPPAMQALVDGGVKLDGFIAPGHVTSITGTGMYGFLALEHGLGVVVSGFEPADLLQSVLMLTEQVESGTPQVEIQYRRVVKPEGNPIARRFMDEIFEPSDDTWRGLGMIPLSGLRIRSRWSAFDAEKVFPLDIPEPPEPKGCICGQILRGAMTPPECALFATRCTPSNPVGACMVSAEGTCATYYKYRT